MGMFDKKSEKAPAAPAPGGLSIIAVGMTIHGDLDSNGTVKVEGTVDGNVLARNQVLVAKGGVVRGDIEARESVVGGAVYGAIQATERVEVQSGATVYGDITTRRIAIAEGGNLNGVIRMSEAVADVRPATRTEARPAPTLPPAPVVRPSIPVARVAVPPRQGASYP